MAKFNFSKPDAGFSLIETMVATSILATALVALAQLFTISVANNLTSRTGTLATILAEQKMEQLRGLMWGFDSAGLPITDTTTDTTVSPEVSTGGTGLSPSPAGALQQNTQGYVDYLDPSGKTLGGGTQPPNNTAYIRRWSVEPLPTNPNNTLVFQVLVTRSRDRGDADLGSVRRLPGEARIITVKTRKTS